MRPIVTSALAVLLACGSPVFAQDSPAPSKAAKSGTILKWTLIGAAAGFGIGFMLGFRAYDDARFAEQKILRTGIIGAVVGGVSGAFLGTSRARASEDRGVQPLDAVAAPPTMRLRVAQPPPHRAFSSLFAPPPIAQN